MSISDVEKISKLSATIVIPMIAAAVYQSFGLWVTSFDWILREYFQSDNVFISGFARATAFFLSVVVIAMSYLVMNAVIFRYKAFLYFLALSLLTFGLLGLATGIDTLVSNEKESISLLFWHFASLCWGFDIFNTVEKSSKLETNLDK